MITAQGWTFRHAGRRHDAVRDLTFRIDDGERVLLLGPSGAGKSTLLRALAGVLGDSEDGQEQGHLLIDGRHPTRVRGRVGLVQQDPQANVILGRVGDDVAFGCENLGIERDLIWPRVRRALDLVSLHLPLDHPTTSLSGGQRQRLGIAGALAMSGAQPGGILLLDEPTANLDPAGVADVHDAVATVCAESSPTLVVVEHRVDTWLDLVDRVIVLTPGGLLADGTPQEVLTGYRDELLDAGVWVPGAGSGLDPLPPHSGSPLLEGRDLTVGWTDDHPVLEHLELAIPEATSTVITGPNGVGKSTTALTLAGLLAPMAGQVVAAPRLVPPPRPRRRLGFADRRHQPAPDPSTWTSTELVTRIGTVFQDPEHEFVATSVRDELAAGPAALGLPGAEVRARVDDLLARLHLQGLAGANPFTLSGGEKRRLSVATVLATGPRVIFLDEPTFGQDRATWLDLVELVRDLVEQGRAVVSVTHDEEYARVMAQHTVHVDSSGIHVAPSDAGPGSAA